MKQLVAALAVSLICGAATGAQDWSSFGKTDCGQWTLATPGDKDIYRTWLAGMLSGMNAARYLWQKNTNDPLQYISMDQASVWMDNFCKINPLEKLTTGGMTLFDQLMGRVNVPK